MARAPWGRTTWIVPLLLFAAVLLVAGLAFNLAHLDTGGESIPGTPTTSNPQPLPAGGVAPDSLGTNLIVVAFLILVGAGAVAVFLRRRKPVAGFRETSWWDIVGTFAALALFFVIVEFWPRATRLGTNQTAPQNNTTGAGGFGPPSVAGIPLAVFLAAGLLGALFVIAFVVRANVLLRPSGPRVSAVRTRQEAAAALDDTIATLQLGGDVREAILACYQRFCILLGRRGLEDQASLTPREIEVLAVDELSVPGDAAGSLTSLFEEARYSEHPLGDADRDRAVRSLEGIRAALGA